METNTQFTRCPNCKTAFKVTEQLLAKAGGKVRCGACLEIFKATDYLIKPTSSNSQRSNKTSGVQAKPQTNSFTMVRDMVEKSLDTSDTSPQNAALNPNKMAPQDRNESSNQAEPPIETSPQRKPTIEFDAAIRNNPFERLIPADSDFCEEDELGLNQTNSEQEQSEKMDFDQWVDEEFEDQIEKTEATATPTRADVEASNETRQKKQTIKSLTREIDALLDFDEDDKDPVKSKKASNSKQKKDSNTTGETKPSHERAHQNMDEQPPKELAAIDKKRPTEFDENAVYEHDIFDDDSFEHPLDDQGQPDLGQTQSMFFDESMLEKLSDQEQANTPISSDDKEAKDLDEDIISIEEYDAQMGIKYSLGEQLEDADNEPDPLDEFDSVVDDYPSEVRNKIIMTAVLLVLVILLIQIWSNRQAIAWNDSWGGAMKSACAVLPCDLKPRRDVSKIKLLQRQVSPDDELEETLDIKIMFVNQAHFDQPYPKIKIIFSDSNNNQVATKTFLPVDYLKDLQQQELMPKNTEVHIEFKTDLDYPDGLGFEFIFE